MTASSMPGLRSDAARNHQRIVTAAAAAFEEDGPAVSLDDIARRAGVGIATLYRRFGTREELIKAVAEHVFAAEIASASWRTERTPGKISSRHSPPPSTRSPLTRS